MAVGTRPSGSAMALVQRCQRKGDANKLSAKKFRKSYARKGLPVVMRGTEDGPTFDELGEMCPDGAMEAYELHAEGKGWAGFSDAKPCTVHDFVMDESAKYGMGLDLKCFCPGTRRIDAAVSEGRPPPLFGISAQVLAVFSSR